MKYMIVNNNARKLLEKQAISLSFSLLAEKTYSLCTTVYNKLGLQGTSSTRYCYMNVLCRKTLTTCNKFTRKPAPVLALRFCLLPFTFYLSFVPSLIASNKNYLAYHAGSNTRASR
jgi:hypothetical protein